MAKYPNLLKLLQLLFKMSKLLYSRKKRSTITSLAMSSRPAQRFVRIVTTQMSNQRIEKESLSSLDIFIIWELNNKQKQQQASRKPHQYLKTEFRYLQSKTRLL